MTNEKLNLAVLFDTNSYRQLTLNKTKSELKVLRKKIRKLELKKDIKAYCIFIVATELLAHLTEGKNGMNYLNCLNSLVFLSNHCYNQKERTINLIPPPYAHVTNSVFGVLPVDYEDSNKRISAFIDNFSIYNGLPPADSYNVEIFERIKQKIQTDESDFSRNIIELINTAKVIVKEKNPKTSEKHLKIKLLEYLSGFEFEQTISMGILKSVAETLGITLSDKELFKRGTYMRTEFPFSVGFLKWIMQKIILGNIDMQSKSSTKKRWNWIWDYQVSFLLTKHTIDNRKIILVTSDKDILNMSRDLGFNNEVLTVLEYMDFLKK